MVIACSLACLVQCYGRLSFAKDRGADLRQFRELVTRVVRGTAGRLSAAAPAAASARALGETEAAAPSGDDRDFAVKFDHKVPSG